jgi:Spy/CpxP family protein refolding chaperone
MSRRVLMLAGLALVGSWSIPAYAQSPQAIAEMMMMGDGPVLVIPVLLEFGDLTAEQTDQVRQIVEAGRPNVQRLLSQVADANNQLADTLLAPAAVRARDAGAIVQRLAQLRLQFMQSELTTVLAIRKILTPEQFGKVTAAMDEMKKADTRQLAPPAGAF